MDRLYNSLHVTLITCCKIEINFLHRLKKEIYESEMFYFCKPQLTLWRANLQALHFKYLLNKYTVCLQMNGAVSKVNKKFISHLTRAQRTPSAAATVQVSHVLPAVRFSCLLRGRGVSLQDGAAAGKGFLCAPF